MAKKGKPMSAALKAFLKRHGRFPRKGELRKERLKSAKEKPAKRHRSSNQSRASGGHYVAKAKGLFGLGLPRVGDMIQGGFYANQFGAFTALDTLTNAASSDSMEVRLAKAGNIVIAKVTSVGNIIGTIITGVVLNVGLKMARKLGGRYTRGWL